MNLHHNFYYVSFLEPIDKVLILYNNEQFLHYAITYNYADIFFDLFGEDGIKKINGLTGQESQQILLEAINKLKENIGKNHYQITEGNVRKVLVNLWSCAKIRPDGIWEVN